MKVAYVITKPDVGGAQAHLRQLMSAAKARHETLLVCGALGPLTEFASSIGVRCEVIPSLVAEVNLVKDIRALTRLLVILGDFRPAIVHCHSTKAGLLGRLAARILGVPGIIFTAHGWVFTDGASGWRKLVGIASERFAALLSHHIITVSEYDRTLALKYRVGSDHQIVRVHNGIADTNLRASSLNDENPLVVVTARLDDPKDHRTLLLATKALSCSGAPFRLLIVGDGPKRCELEHLTEELGLTATVEFLGSRTDVEDILSTADLFVLPSNYEGFPISILEAMRAGLPVISTDVGGCREAVTHGTTGYLVERGDVESLEFAIRRLVDDPALRRRLGQAARESYELNFGEAVMLERTFNVYQRALGDSRPLTEPPSAYSARSATRLVGEDALRELKSGQGNRE